MFVFISLCLSVTKSVPTRRNWNFLMTLLISFVLIKILEFFDAVKNNRRNEVLCGRVSYSGRDYDMA